MLVVNFQYKENLCTFSQIQSQFVSAICYLRYAIQIVIFVVLGNISIFEYCDISSDKYIYIFEYRIAGIF